MKNIRRLLLVPLSMLFFTANSVFAQTVPAETSLQEKNVITVATVNIFDMQIVSQEKNKLKISFELSNREQSQPGTKYAVRLIKQIEEKQLTVDEKVYPETVYLGENQSLKKEITYNAPQYLSGEYALQVIAKNANGFPLATSLGENIKLEGDDKYLEMIQESCYLKTKGDDSGKKYGLTQVVEIGNETELVVVCDVENHFKESVSFVPKFSVYQKSVFGEEFKDIESATIPAVSLEAGKKEAVEFVVPKTNTPQLYETVLVLENDKNKTISNEITFRYLLKGASATIQNFILDNDVYTKGEIATATLLWSAAGIENNEVSTKIILQNEKKEICALVEEELGWSFPSIKLELPIANECINFTTTVAIQDKDGNILDQKEFLFNSPSYIQNETQKQGTVQKKDNTIEIFGIVMIAALLVALLLLVVFKKKLLVGVFLIIASGTFAVGSQNAKADTFFVPDFDSDGNSSQGYYFNVTLDKSAYAPGETITAEGESWPSYTITGTGETLELFLKATISGTENTMFSYGTDSSKLDIDSPFALGNNLSGDTTGTAEAIPGAYEVIFTACAVLADAPNSCDDSINWNTVKIPYITVGSCTYTTSVKTWGTCHPSGIQYADTYNYATIPGNTCIDEAPTSQACDPAEPDVATCPFVSTPNSQVIDFNGGMSRSGRDPIRYLGGVNRSFTESGVFIAAGTYDIETASWDGYANRIASGISLDERYTIQFIKNTTVLATIGPTTDIADLVQQDTKLDSFGPIVLADNVNILKAFHINYPNSGGSVIPVCLKVSKVGSELPDLTLSASPEVVPYGTSSVITWTTSNVDFCWSSGDWSEEWRPINGSETATSIISDKTFKMECWNSTGQSTGVETITITFACPPGTPDNNCLSHPIVWNGACNGDCALETKGTETGFCNDGCGGVGSASRSCDLGCPIKFEVDDYRETDQ